MKEEQSEQKQITNSLDFKSYVEELNKRTVELYPNCISAVNKGELEFRNIDQIERLIGGSNQESSKTSKGRGGNNVSENVKKSIRSIFRKRLGEPLYKQYEERYIDRYQLKSQKENYILYFLFLQELRAQGKISGETIENMTQEIQQKIGKFASNSEERMENESERKEFHEKNLIEFRKVLEIDVDFGKQRDYAEIKESIKKMYLKKQAVYREAEQKVRRILEKHPLLMGIFRDQAQQSYNPSPQNSETILPDQQRASESSLSS